MSVTCLFVFKGRLPIERASTKRGKQRQLTIGRWGRGNFGINDARKAATTHRDAFRPGRDPAIERDVYGEPGGRTAAGPLSIH